MKGSTVFGGLVLNNACFYLLPLVYIYRLIVKKYWCWNTGIDLEKEKYITIYSEDYLYVTIPSLLISILLLCAIINKHAQQFNANGNIVETYHQFAAHQNSPCGRPVCHDTAFGNHLLKKKLVQGDHWNIKKVIHVFL